MNTRAKGNRLEKKVEDILKDEGYLVERANPKLRFIGPGKVRSVTHDFFGCWDLIAVPAAGGQVRFIQVSVWKKMSEKIKQVKDFPLGEIAYATEIWVWYGKGKNAHFRLALGTSGYQWQGLCKRLKTVKKDLNVGGVCHFSS